ncbi:MAG TPA: helix-turn-helix transcriptional regulator [Ktedonobacterales bacterium]
MDGLQAMVGAVVRRERQARGMTLKELAARSIVSVVYLGEIERGKKYPSPVVLERLASGLDLATPDLLMMIAIALRGEERVEARPIGFTAPSLREPASAGSGGRIVNMIVSLVA